MSLQLTIDSAGLARAMANGPRTLERHLKPAIFRATLDITNAARRGAAKASSTLTNAILGTMTGPLEGQVKAGTDYARAVEEGTGPGRMPPVRSLQDWIRVKGIKPNDPTMDPEDLAFVMARSIAIKGTPAQPYMAPALDSQRARAEQRIEAAIDAALREITH